MYFVLDVLCLCCGVGSQLKFKVSEKNVLACAFCVCLCPKHLNIFFTACVCMLRISRQFLFPKLVRESLVLFTNV